jgi:hypothetical protein
MLFSHHMSLCDLFIIVQSRDIDCSPKRCLDFISLVSESKPILCISNKDDLYTGDVVDIDYVTQSCKTRENICHLNVSAKSGHNINRVLSTLMELRTRMCNEICIQPLDTKQNTQIERLSSVNKLRLSFGNLKNATCEWMFSPRFKEKRSSSDHIFLKKSDSFIKRLLSGQTTSSDSNNNVLI